MICLEVDGRNIIIILANKFVFEKSFIFDFDRNNFVRDDRVILYLNLGEKYLILTIFLGSMNKCSCQETMFLELQGTFSLLVVNLILLQQVISINGLQVSFPRTLNILPYYT